MSFIVRVALGILIISSVLMMTGCQSLKFNNALKTTTTTAVAYAIAGPIPAVLNLGTSIIIDEISPQDTTVDQIETKEQAAAFVIEKTLMYGVWAFIGFLLITVVIAPWLANKRGYTQAKRKYSVTIPTTPISKDND